MKMQIGLKAKISSDVTLVTDEWQCNKNLKPQDTEFKNLTEVINRD